MPKPHKLADGRYECQNCLKKFSKNAKTYKEPLFCCNQCRYKFHSAGGMSLKRIEDLMGRIAETRVREMVKETSLKMEARA